MPLSDPPYDGKGYPPSSASPSEKPFERAEEPAGAGRGESGTVIR